MGHKGGQTLPLLYRVLGAAQLQNHERDDRSQRQGFRPCALRDLLPCREGIKEGGQVDMRLSSDSFNPAGEVVNGYDYDLQVWVIDGIVQDCGHPARMRHRGPCCDAHLYAGMDIQQAKRAFEAYGTDKTK